MTPDPLEQLRDAVADSATALGDGTKAPTLDRPPKADFGDYSTNAAMLLAPTLGDAPRSIAGRTTRRLSSSSRTTDATPCS